MTDLWPTNGFPSPVFSLEPPPPWPASPAVARLREPIPGIGEGQRTALRGPGRLGSQGGTSSDPLHAWDAAVEGLFLFPTKC